MTFGLLQTRTYLIPERSCPGHMFEDSYEDHVHARKTSSHAAINTAPFDEERHAAASLISSNHLTTIDDILAEIRKRHPKPSAEQLSILEHFVERMKLERLEARLNSINRNSQDPLFALTHGLPSTSKSQLISWLRELIERGLGWTHGVQFVCLAFQNAMVAQINGFTIHHWSGIPARNSEGEGTGDSHQQSIKCQALRVILLDEISMVAAELLGTLEYVYNRC